MATSEILCTVLMSHHKKDMLEQEKGQSTQNSTSPTSLCGNFPPPPTLFHNVKTQGNPIKMRGKGLRMQKRKQPIRKCPINLQNSLQDAVT